MKNFIAVCVSTTLVICIATVSFAGNRGNGSAGGIVSGKSGTAGSQGKPGIPGCNGDTDPSPDGKFYLPGTNQECNPGDQDRQKLKKLRVDQAR